MNLNPKDIVTVKHYSGITPFKSLVVEVCNDHIVVQLTKEFALMNFLLGDPVVYGYEKDGMVCTYGGNVLYLELKDNVAIFSIDQVDVNAEKRQVERYPVSLYADIKIDGERKKQIATIKDISYFGILMYSKADLETNIHIGLDVYMDKTMLFLRSFIVRKSENPNYFQYGLSIIYEDITSQAMMKDYIRRLVKEQEEEIRKLRNK